MEVDHKICSGQNRTETERAARDEKAAQTSEGSIGYLRRQSLCVPDLQEDLPIADWALQPQSPLQLDRGMTTKAQTQCLTRQKDANNSMRREIIIHLYNKEGELESPKCKMRKQHLRDWPDDTLIRILKRKDMQRLCQNSKKTTEDFNASQ